MATSSVNPPIYSAVPQQEELANDRDNYSHNGTKSVLVSSGFLLLIMNFIWTLAWGCIIVSSQDICTDSIIMENATTLLGVLAAVLAFSLIFLILACLLSPKSYSEEKSPACGYFWIVVFQLGLIVYSYVLAKMIVSTPGDEVGCNNITLMGAVYPYIYTVCFLMGFCFYCKTSSKQRNSPPTMSSNKEDAEVHNENDITHLSE
jgi:uncharacterized membrane protein